MATIPTQADGQHISPANISEDLESGVTSGGVDTASLEAVPVVDRGLGALAVFLAVIRISLQEDKIQEKIPVAWALSFG
jgi:hypothetical protein